MVTQKIKIDFQNNLIFAVVLFLVGFPFTALFFDFGRFTAIKIIKEITLPSFAIYYSVGWLIIHFEIKNLKKEIFIGKSTLLRHVAIKSDKVCSYSETLDKKENKLLKAEQKMEFTNITLRIFAILTSFLLIISIFF